MLWNKSDDQLSITFARLFVNSPRIALNLMNKKALKDPGYQKEYDQFIERSELGVEKSDSANRKAIKKLITTVENTDDPILENTFFDRIFYYKDAMR